MGVLAPLLDVVAGLTATVSVPITAALLANRSLFAHAFFTARGASPDPMAAAADRWATTHTLQPLVVYGERLKPSGLRNLLTDEPAPWEAALQAGLDAAAAAGKAEQWIAYWKPGLHLQLVVDHEVRPLGTMPPLYHNFLRGHGLVEAGRGSRFRPLVYVNELTVMRMHWIAINTTRARARSRANGAGPTAGRRRRRRREAARACELPLELSFKPLAVSRFQWMVNLKHSFAMRRSRSASPRRSRRTCAACSSTPTPCCCTPPSPSRRSTCSSTSSRSRTTCRSGRRSTRWRGSRRARCC